MFSQKAQTHMSPSPRCDGDLKSLLVSVPLRRNNIRIMAMRAFYNEVKGKKVKELPGYFKPMLSINYVKNTVKRGLDTYHAKYIETSSVDPLYHICFGGMIFSYLVALPEERRHLQHKQEHAAGKH